MTPEITRTPIDGLMIVHFPTHGDERGTFTRLYCRETLDVLGAGGMGDQWSLSRNPRRGTLRGLHYQAPPMLETKLVRCLAGRVFDAVVDLRPDSPTLGTGFWIELSADDGRALRVPPGLAHGFLTLEDDSDLLYAISPAYDPASARGVRWDDPAFAIPWPMVPEVISSRDATLPLWSERNR